MVYILIYKTSLTIEDSFCVQERVKNFIASQLTTQKLDLEGK